MEPGEIIAIIAIALIIGGAIFYVIKAKKGGKKCIGCPGGCACDGKSCSEKSNACNGCQGDSVQK